MPAGVILTLLLIAGGLPLLLYPFLLLANVMSLSALENHVKPPAFSFKAFLWTSTAYPLVYIPACLAALKRLRTERVHEALLLSVLPLLLLAVIGALYWRWDALEKAGKE